jgi:glucose/arabinose dehydrogenase
MLSVPVTTREGFHMGGNLHFGPDGMLYVSIGDIGDEAAAQEIDALTGRIHRFAVVDDALVPAPGNPFPDNSTWAYGLRNPFDFDFDPVSGDIIAGENGPTCDDEINLIFAGGNYGWRPDYPCDDRDPQQATRFVYPLVYYTPPEAITGVMIYDGSMFPEWQNDVFFCGWNRGIMRRMTLNEDRTLVESITDVLLPNQTCSTDIEVAPDGAIYFTNYNSIYRILAR